MSYCLLDLDGTVYDMCNALKRVLAEDGITFIPENVVTYSFGGDIGCSKSDVYKRLSDIRTFKAEVPYDGAVDSIKKLLTYTEVYPYTKIADIQELIEYRCEQIKSLGMIGRPITSDKKTVINGNVDAVFDDCIGVMEEWVDKPEVKLFLINQTYNQNLGDKLSARPNVFRCDSLAEAVDLYISMRN